jgi:integrase
MFQRFELRKQSGGQGRDRTGDLPLFRRTLVPTELPGRKATCA